MRTARKESLSEAIRQVRASKRETQTNFAMRIGVAAATLARYEIGTQVPKLSILKSLADFATQDSLSRPAKILHRELERMIREKRQKEELRNQGTLGQLKAMRHLLESSHKNARTLLDGLVHPTVADAKKGSELYDALLLNMRHSIQLQNETMALFKELLKELVQELEDRHSGRDS
jgi:transcriptional regulator with XRE-family HTH domain